VSGAEVDKSALFEVFYGELETAPMIAECRVNLECRVVKAFGIEHRRIYVGEVVQVYVDEACVVEKEGRRGIVPMTELAPIIYGLDNRYYSVSSNSRYGAESPFSSPIYGQLLGVQHCMIGVVTRRDES
jgi:flavin reductase (DIM6/NTAB) family NADH-FMN oxidoreductase RutF